jgi:hypothetical protein
MNPRKVGTPTNETSIVDDFGIEERILDSPVEPLEMFLPEPGLTGTAQRTPLLDLGELPLRRSPRLSTAVPPAYLRPRRSVLRSMSAVGVVAVSIVLALIAGAVVRNRLDVPALSASLETALSDYFVVDRTSAPVSRQVLPPAEVVREPATTASTTGTTDRGPATAAPAKSVAAAKKPDNVQRPPEKVQRPAASSARSAAPVPAATPLTRTLIERREASRPPAPAVAATTAPSAVPAVSAAPAAPAASSAPAAPPANSAAAAPPASSAPAVPIVTAAAPVSTPNPAPPPSAPVSAPSATPAGGLTAETRAVALALNRYQDAFSALDAGAVHAVWPSVDVRALAKAFDQLEDQTFELEGCDIAVAGAQAEADCGGNARYTRKVGNRTLRVEPRRWHFKLRETNGQWVIDAVDAR